MQTKENQLLTRNQLPTVSRKGNTGESQSLNVVMFAI